MNISHLAYIHFNPDFTLFSERSMSNLGVPRNAEWIWKYYGFCLCQEKQWRNRKEVIPGNGPSSPGVYGKLLSPETAKRCWLSTLMAGTLPVLFITVPPGSRTVLGRHYAPLVHRLCCINAKNTEQSLNSLHTCKLGKILSFPLRESELTDLPVIWQISWSESISRKEGNRRGEPLREGQVQILTPLWGPAILATLNLIRCVPHSPVPWHMATLC